MTGAHHYPDRVADRVLADLPDLGDAWHALVVHARTATSNRPSAKWERQGRALLDAVGAEPARDRIHEWLGLVGRPRTMPLRRQQHEPDINNAFDPYNANAVRGLVWLLAFLPPHPDTARVLGGLVETALRKVAGIGPRNPKVANAAVYALSRMDGEAALAQLARLATRVTYKGTLKELNAALEARAAALNLSRDEVEELAVPTYGLTEVGRRIDAFGAATAELTVNNRRTVLTWRNAAGRTVKAPPAAVRRDHATHSRNSRRRSRTSRRCSPRRPNGSTGSSSPGAPGRTPRGASATSTIRWSAPSPGA